MTLQTVALPRERFAQLKLLAQKEKTSLSDTIAHLLDGAIATNRLPDALPGWAIQRIGDNVLLTHEESGFAKLMPVSSAASIGETLHHFGSPMKGRSGHLDIDVMIEIRRRGAGVIMRDANSFAEITMAGNVAADIGKRLIRAAE